MKNNILKKIGLACIGAMTLFPSCEDFLDRPTEDRPTGNTFYQTEQELAQAVNPLYCISWFSYQRMWIEVGDVLAGNYGKGTSNIYTTLMTGTAGANDNLANGSGGLYSVVSFANITMNNIQTVSPVADEIKNKYLGECMLMKAAAYFFLVRTWGEVPIIDDNVKVIGEGGSYGLYKNTEEDIYKYVITLLLQAAEYLPEQNATGRVDKYSAYGLLSKVYLYYGCMKDKDQHLLEQSIKYAEMVEKSPHGELMPVYGKLFRAEGETCPETLIALHWAPDYTPYPSININHCDMGPKGLNETGAWGEWNYVTVDLMNLFGVKSIDNVAAPYGEKTLRPDSYQDADLTVAKGYDVRRAATMCLYHDWIPFWRRNKDDGSPKGNGFYCTYNISALDNDNTVDKENKEVEWRFPTGAAPVKQIHGSIFDHEQEFGCTPNAQGSCMPMILLRTADVYLCAGEAYYHLGNTDKAKAYIGKVRERAGVGDKEYTLDMKFIVDERRRELAFEGDNYYDLRRWSYFDEASAVAYIKGQERNSLKCGYFEGDGCMQLTIKTHPETAMECNEDINLSSVSAPTNAKGEPFLLSYPDKDVDANHHLLEEAVPFDFSQISFYDESKI